MTRLEFGIVTTVFDEFLGKKRVKFGAINNFNTRLRLNILILSHD